MIRALYGGSNRAQHLRLSRHLSVLILCGGLFHNFAWLPLWMIAALACIAQESWATADRDLYRRHWYWAPFARIVPHRGLLSHGLVIGTVVRLVYGWWWLMPALWVIHPAALLAWCAGALANDAGHLLLDL
jgi:divalent metal cation (Fe/Co/Zn/Cd) transporter